MEQHSDLRNRLRRMGKQPVPPRVADVHLDGIASTSARPPRRLGSLGVVAAAAAFLLGIGGAAAISGSSDLDDVVIEQTPAAVAQQVPGGEEAADPQVTPADPFPDDDCKGPPPFAGEEPASAEARAQEAEDFARFRADNCPDEETDLENEGEDGGPPDGVPSGPPEEVPSGQPEGTPSGQPEGTPSGQPEEVPSGQPEGTPTGPPEAVGGS